MSEFSKTADKAITLLVALSGSGWDTPQRLATRMDISRTVVQRLLTTLVQQGLAVNKDGEYALSWKLRRLADAVQSTLLRAAVQPMIELSARTRETVVLQVIDGENAVVLHEVVHSSGMRVQARHEVGTRSPLVQSASGLAILASLDHKQLGRAFRGEHDADAWTQRLQQIRDAGVAMTSNELQQGVSGIAVPLRRPAADPPASLAVIAPTSRVDLLVKHTGALRRSAAEIEHGLRLTTSID